MAERPGHRFTGDRGEVSARMRLIRGKNTKPELALFKILADAGVRFATHQRVEGVSVDALVEDRVAVFVDSPFWHLRDRSDLDRLSPYWQERLLRNRRRDQRQTRRLRKGGCVVVRIWADEIDGRRVLRRIRAACCRQKEVA